MKFKIYTGLIFLMLFAFTANGQQLLFNNISTELGLPAQESYNVMQDSKGFIWISTEAGLCKYNGSHCKVFDKKNGLKENSCYAVAEDDKGDLWLLTSANRVLKYESDSLKEASFNEKLKSQFKNTITQAYNLSFKNDSVIVSTHTLTFQAGINSKDVDQIFGDTTVGYYFIKNKNKLVNIKSDPNAKLLNEGAQKGFFSIGIQNGKEIKKIEVPILHNSQPDWRVLIANNKKGDNFIAIKNTVIKLNKNLDHTLFELPYDILGIYCDKNDGLWIGTLKGGVYYFPDSQNLNSSILSLNGYSVTGICVDAENGVWCSTLEKGIFYCRNKNVISYSNVNGLEKPADVLKYAGGKIVIASGTNELIEFEKNSIKKQELNLDKNNTIADIIADENGWIICGKFFIARSDLNFKNIEFIRNELTNFNISASALNYTGSKRLFGINYGEVFEVIGNKTVYRKLPLESAGRCLLAVGDHKLLCGCKDGLYRMFINDSNTNTNYVTEKVNGLEGAIVRILKTGKGKVWICTKENGLYLYQNDSLVNMTGRLKLPTERFFDIAEDPRGRIWVATGAGLMVISANNEVKLYTVFNGLPSNEIYKVAVDGDFVYISTTEGISRFNLNAELLNETAPAIYLNTLKANGFKIKTDRTISLDCNSNSLKAEFDVLTFKETITPELYYTLKGLNALTYRKDTVKGNEIALENLGPNAYELTVYAVNCDGLKSAKPVILYFEIVRPYWQNAWFIVAVTLIVCVLIYLFTSDIIRGIRKKEEEKTRINKQVAEYQMTALQAQMNPHFIFNAINSIQNYILKKKEQEAYNYLAKFSKLIRMVLNNSEQKTVLLNDELETVKLYVALEQLRFRNNFTFRLDIGDSVNIYKVQVPTMLIQPYVENAIWHGLMNQEEGQQGILRIIISREGPLLKIVIEDNGIGRARSVQYKKESVHKPVAMNLTEKRLKMINTMSDYTGAKVVLTDLKDTAGKPCGTRVEIFLPM